MLLLGIPFDYHLLNINVLIIHLNVLVLCLDDLDETERLLDSYFLNDAEF